MAIVTKNTKSSTTKIDLFEESKKGKEKESKMTIIVSESFHLSFNNMNYKG